MYRRRFDVNSWNISHRLVYLVQLGPGILDIGDWEARINVVDSQVMVKSRVQKGQNCWIMASGNYVCGVRCDWNSYFDMHTFNC